MRRTSRRSAFTLLEVLLALGIAVVLLAAVYAAVDTQLKQAQAARDLVEQSAVARNLFARMSNDMAAATQLSDPGRYRNQAQSNNSGGGASGGMGMAGGMGATGGM